MSSDSSSKTKVKEDLRKWVKQKWVDIGAPKKGGGYKPCGRSEGEKRKGYPKCVPASKASNMSKKDKKSAVKRKRAAGNAGPKPTNVSTDVDEKKLCSKGKSAAKNVVESVGPRKSKAKAEASAPTLPSDAFDDGSNSSQGVSNSSD